MKVAIVIRQLGIFRPVVSTIIKERDNPLTVDNMDDYLESRAHQHIEEFKEKFIEFKQAQFYIEIKEVEE